MNPCHGRGDRITGEIAFKAVKILIRHHPSHPYKTQVAVALSRLNITGEDKTAMDDEVTILTVAQEVLSCAPQTEIHDFKFIAEPKGPFVSFIS